MRSQWVEDPKPNHPPWVTGQERDKDFNHKDTGPQTAEDTRTRDKPMPARPEEVLCNGGFKATDGFASTNPDEDFKTNSPDDDQRAEEREASTKPDKDFKTYPPDDEPREIRAAMEKLERRRKARDVRYQLQWTTKDKDGGEKDKEGPENQGRRKEARED